MARSPASPTPTAEAPRSFGARALDWIERVGNKLPDPALLFVFAMLITWLLSAIFDGHAFDVMTKDGVKERVITSQVEGSALIQFFTDMVKTFTSFHPLGVVLVAMLGVGVAEHSGYINAGLKKLIAVTPKLLLTPMLILVALVSHTAADAGYVLVIPLGAVIFYAAGRHPLAGITAAFAGVSGGFSANPAPSSLDPMLAGITQQGAQLMDATRVVNPLSNWIFTASSSVVIILIGWWLTDRVIEPRLNRRAPVDADPADMPKFDAMTALDRTALRWATLAMLAGLAVFAVFAIPGNSMWRGKTGELTSSDAPLMQAIVPIIFLVFLIPGVVFGYVSGAFKSHRDVVKAMAKSMSGMGYYLVMAFFASLFIYSFGKSELGTFLAVQGAAGLKAAALPGPVTIVLIILLTAMINLLIGSASAKWTLLAPIFVPMLMQLGLSPELTQGAYRVGDSTTNIVTPLMPYFPLVVAFSQRYVKSTGVGTLISLMLPYTIAFLVAWTVYLLAFWGLGLPLGLGGAGYAYP